MNRFALLLIALAMIAFGGYRQLQGASTAPEDRARCESLAREHHATAIALRDEMVARCDDPGTIALMDGMAAGDSAQEMAARIATANKAGHSAYLLDWGMIGCGIAFLIAALSRRRRA